MVQHDRSPVCRCAQALYCCIGKVYPSRVHRERQRCSRTCIVAVFGLCFACGCSALGKRQDSTACITHVQGDGSVAAAALYWHIFPANLVHTLGLWLCCPRCNLHLLQVVVGRVGMPVGLLAVFVRGLISVGPAVQGRPFWVMVVLDLHVTGTKAT